MENKKIIKIILDYLNKKTSLFELKEEIQKMYLKGTGNEDDRDKLNEEYKSKFDFY